MSTDPPLLSIGELAAATGVGTATLRAWESRLGFPEAVRLPSGHRRYRPQDVDAVREVARRRDAGLRLGAAVADVRGSTRTGPASVFATLRRTHRHLAVERLHKRTLTALSRAIEDEIGAKAERARLFGAFQADRFFRPARARWRELARVAGSTVVIAADHDDEDGDEDGDRIVRVGLPEDSPMLREWAVVCDSHDLPVALSAWELPGQEDRSDRDRVFEAIWTVEPLAVRDAARACAALVPTEDPASALLVAALADDPTAGEADLAALQALFLRVLAYVDA